MMPKQKPGRSVQDVGTPEEFIMAVEAKFGNLSVDLAATSRNAKAPAWISPEENSLKKKWRFGGNLWLNPPFGNIRPWVAKCDRFTRDAKAPMGQRILVLVPASVGSNWFAEHAWEKARIFFIRPRLQFVGHDAGFPKDLMLMVYGMMPGIELWQWKKTRSKS